MNKGKVILIFGVSAVGKTYYKNLIEKNFQLKGLSRVLTRERRDEELDTKDLYITKEEFNDMRTKDKFFIDTDINGQSYGFLKSDINELNNGTCFVGDCYYKLIGKLKKELKDNLVTICIQPKNILDSLNRIENERNDYKQRVSGALEEYDYWNKNQSVVDYVVYTEYNKKTDNEIINIVSNILRNKD